MYTARIVVLTIALSAGGVAAYLANGSDNKSLQTEPVVQSRTVDVLVANSGIALGQSVAPEEFHWQTWPTANASNSFIRRNEGADATTGCRFDCTCANHRRRADPREPISDTQAPRRGESVNVVRYAISTPTTIQK